MKQLENKLTSIPLNETSNARYSDLLMLVINRPLKSGVTTQDMRRDFKILDKLEASKDVIEFTDEELAYIKASLPNVQYPLKHRDVVDFEDYIESID
jgi:hypothetical protein